MSNPFRARGDGNTATLTRNKKKAVARFWNDGRILMVKIAQLRGARPVAEIVTTIVIAVHRIHMNLMVQSTLSQESICQALDHVSDI